MDVVSQIFQNKKIIPIHQTFYKIFQQVAKI
jgi:hypothetical protein